MKPNSGTIIFAIFLFFIFLIIRFPYHNLKGWVFNKVYQSTGIHISAEELYPVFIGWPGFSLRKVNLSLPVGASELNLSADKVIARVSPAGIFPPHAAFSMKIKSLKKGGNLYLKFSESKSRVATEVDADTINLEQVQLAAISGSLQGLLTAEGDLEIQLADLARSTGSIELKIKKLKVPTQTVPMSATYSFLIPSMTINDLSARITIRNAIAEINEFKFGSPETDISGALAGDIRLAQTFENSALNLTLRLRLLPSYQNNPQAVTFVSFLKTYRDDKTGTYGLRCRATFHEITTQYKCAIPENVEGS